MRKCKRCGIKKKVEDFYAHKSRKDGLRADCIECVAHKLRIRNRVNKIAGAKVRKARIPEKTHPSFMKDVRITTRESSTITNKAAS